MQNLKKKFLNNVYRQGKLKKVHQHLITVYSGFCLWRLITQKIVPNDPLKIIENPGNCYSAQASLKYKCPLNDVPPISGYSSLEINWNIQCDGKYAVLIYPFRASPITYLKYLLSWQKWKLPSLFLFWSFITNMWEVKSAESSFHMLELNSDFNSCVNL